MTLNKSLILFVLENFMFGRYGIQKTSYFSIQSTCNCPSKNNSRRIALKNIDFTSNFQLVTSLRELWIIGTRGTRNVRFRISKAFQEIQKIAKIRNLHLWCGFFYLIKICPGFCKGDLFFLNGQRKPDV